MHERSTSGDPSFRVLVVCVGNVCRSAQAERLLRLRLDALLGSRADRISVASAGVRALVGHPMDASSARELARIGGDAAGFTSRQLVAADVLGADLVLTATKSLRSRVLVDAAPAVRRTFTLTEFAALVRDTDAESPRALVDDAARRRSAAAVRDYDIFDPIGGSAAVHRGVADEIDQAVRVAAAAIAAACGVSSRC